MADDMKPGSVVQLKSGGPPMTLERMSGASSAVCSWFDHKNEAVTKIFTITSLKPAAS